MILKKENVERIVKAEAIIERLKADGWEEVVTENKKTTKKEKQEGAE